MPERPKLIEMRPDQALLNPNFDGYKLSLTKIPTITRNLQSPVERLVPDFTQYSFLHAKLFGLHNHLVGETTPTESVYFIDKEMKIQKFTQSNGFVLTTVWQIPKKQHSNGDFNCSLKLLDKLAVVADGMGTIYVLNRLQKEQEEWQVSFSEEVLGTSQHFIISDTKQIDSQLHLLLTSIGFDSISERHVTLLHWITLEKTESWHQIALRQLTINGFVQYTNLEKNCEAIYIVSDSKARFTLDSENEIKNDDPEEPQRKKYKWYQNGEELTVTFPVQHFNNDLLKIDCDNVNMTVEYQNDIILSGSLHERINHEMTNWNFRNDNLTVVLRKCETGLMWPELIQGDANGEFVPNDELIQEATERLAPLTTSTEDAPVTGTTFNSQPIEECDFECDKLTIFERISRDSHRLTHRINLGAHQILLTVNLESGLELAMGLRNDIDTCIWQPKMADDFILEHKGTLLALGYIQASKRQMKFFVCSPDFSYSAICESTKHIFIYCQNKLIGDNELRNRTTGRRVSSLAQQQVVSLSNNEEILGIFASNTYLYILGESYITALKL